MCCHANPRMLPRRQTARFLFSVASIITGFLLIVIGWNGPVLIAPDSRLYQVLSIIREPDQLSMDRGFLVDTPYCKIPDMNPFDPTVLAKIKAPRPIDCLGKPSITYVHGSELKLNRQRIENDLNGDFKYCQYQPVIRGPWKSDFKFTYGDPSKRFDHDIIVPPEHEYIRVYCYSQSDGKISTNFHALVTPKEQVEHRCDYQFQQHKKKHKPRETYNVHMIGVDSVSRLSFLRRMPLTLAYLREELRAFEMAGYNKIADNTFVNIVPMMTGRFVEETGWNETMRNQPFDNFPFIWKNFSQAGYRTLYAEDAPKIAIFVYGKAGFKEPPADYYNRHLALALEKQKNVWNRNHHCIVDRLETTMLLDYVTDFARVFQDKPHFSFTFITRLSHDYLDNVGAGDKAYEEFLRRFNKEGHFNNSILIIYGDHGFRFGDLRFSYMGRIEERLPVMFLVFPPSFHEKYPKLVQNLRTNARRLTTPLDIYETLKDILYFDGLDRKASSWSRGISLLREVPAERTCDSAAILPHWCLCLEQKHIKPHSKQGITVAEEVVKQINEILSPASHLCARLSLYNVSEIVEMVSNDKVLRFQGSFYDVINRTVKYGDKTQAPTIFQVTLTTVPGFALFESTLVFYSDINKYKLGGDISRINAYKDQSICVDNSRLKKFCYCIT